MRASPVLTILKGALLLPGPAHLHHATLVIQVEIDHIPKVGHDD